MPVPALVRRSVATWFMYLLSAGSLVNTVFAGEFVQIGAAGNGPSPEGWGAVAYEFSIGRYEVTNAQYAEFLNAVARESDPSGLYSRLMSQHFWGGIQRSSDDGKAFKYRAKVGYERLPVTFVTWWSAARYVNWLHFGRPDTGTSHLGTTEGTDTLGAYDTRDETQDVIRNEGARYWIPNRDEWSKAAFYDNSTPNGRWWRSATDPTHLPLAGPPGEGGGAANFFDGRWAAPFPHLTEVGAYSGSPGPWGTYDQAGNVHEWVEDAPGPQRHTLLGGALFLYGVGLERSYAESELASYGLGSVGFRVARLASLPPPPAPMPQERRTAAKKNGKGESGQSFMRFVLVDEAGNEADPLYGIGSVSYVFEIGEHEITNAQYASFLNAVAAQSDPHGLWHPDMSGGVIGGIVRNQDANGRFSYTTNPGWAERPVTYVSWYDLARFANWMHFGRPTTGRSEPGTTEGDDGSGAYDTSSFPAPGEAARYDDQPARRNVGATYWIPNQDEWYKAAYFDPTRFGARRYWDYATRSSTPPVAEPPPGGSNSAAYLAEDHLAIGGPFYLPEADAYISRSYFGTQGQAGGVWEWLEDWRSQGDGSGWRENEWTRALRGGSFGYNKVGLHAQTVDPGEPSQEYFVYGGRLARAVVGATASTPSIRDRVRLWLHRTSRRALAIQVFLLGTGFSLAVCATLAIAYAGFRTRSAATRRKHLPCE